MSGLSSDRLPDPRPPSLPTECSRLGSGRVDTQHKRSDPQSSHRAPPAIACVLPLRHDAPRLFDGLTHRALPVVMLSAVGGGASLVLLWRRRYDFARVTAFVAVASVVAGWGVAQYPDFLPGTATIDQAAGARAALVGLLVVFGLAVVTVVPSLAYLFSMSRSGASTCPTHPLPPRRRP